MIAYRELESPATPYSPASYRIVELTEEEMGESALIFTQGPLAKIVFAAVQGMKMSALEMGLKK